MSNCRHRWSKQVDDEGLVTGEVVCTECGMNWAEEAQAAVSELFGRTAEKASITDIHSTPKIPGREPFHEFIRATKSDYVRGEEAGKVLAAFHVWLHDNGWSIVRHG